MQQALEALSPDAARDWVEAMASRQTSSRCALCKAEAKLRIAEREPGGTATMDVCADCAPAYLRKLADIIEGGECGG